MPTESIRWAERIKQIARVLDRCVIASGALIEAGMPLGSLPATRRIDRTDESLDIQKESAWRP